MQSEMVTNSRNAQTSRPNAESLTHVDISRLSQSELQALSLCSSSAFDLHCTDDLIIPKIDRFIFNESAGSRRQTFPRLHPATAFRQPHQSISSLHHHHRLRHTGLLPGHRPPSVPNDDPERLQNEKIVRMLVNLIKNRPLNDPRGVNEVAMPSDIENRVVFHVDDAMLNVVQYDGRKRKRGRQPNVKVDNGKVLNIINKDGVPVDLYTLATMENPYGEELKSRTAGLETEEDVLGFMRGLEGKWGSARKKRKIVNASDFGNMLPDGWKLLLGLKRKKGRVWLYCRRYISPSGQQFATCNEVSSFLQSYFGKKSSMQLLDFRIENIQQSSETFSGSHAGITYNNQELRRDMNSTLPETLSNEYEKEVSFLGIANLTEVQVRYLFECHKCNITFDEKDKYLQHLMSSHQKTTRRYRICPSVGRGVSVKDGKFECQFCHKIFDEKHRYDDHVESHVRNNVKRPESECKNDSIVDMMNVVHTPEIATATSVQVVNFNPCSSERNLNPCTSEQNLILCSIKQSLNPCTIKQNLNPCTIEQNINSSNISRSLGERLNKLDDECMNHEETTEIDATTPVQHLDDTPAITTSTPVQHVNLNPCIDGQKINSSNIDSNLGDKLKLLDDGRVYPKETTGIDNASSNLGERPKQLDDGCMAPTETIDIDNASYMICEIPAATFVQQEDYYSSPSKQKTDKSTICKKIDEKISKHDDECMVHEGTTYIDYATRVRELNFGSCLIEHEFENNPVFRNLDTELNMQNGVCRIPETVDNISNMIPEIATIIPDCQVDIDSSISELENENNGIYSMIPEKTMENNIFNTINMKQSVGGKIYKTSLNCDVKDYVVFDTEHLDYKSGANLDYGNHVLTTLKTKTICDDNDMNRICTITSDHPRFDVMDRLNVSRDEINSNVVNETMQQSSQRNESSMTMVDSLTYHPMFYSVSDQGGGQFSNTDKQIDTGFEELKFDEIEPFHFGSVSVGDLTPYQEVHMNRGFDSSLQFETEEVMLNMASMGPHLVVCVWCRNEFNHESIGSEMGSDYVGFMCSTCKINISGQLNIFNGR